MKREINGVSLAVEEQGTGETVLLVHGSNSDHRTWQQQMDTLSDQYHLVSYSRRYHYPNDPIPEDTEYSMEEHLNDLHTLINQLEDDYIHLVGHSYGGLLALGLAIRYPDLIQSLVLIEPPIFSLFLDIPPSILQILKLLFTKPLVAISIIRFFINGVKPAEEAAKQGDLEEASQIFGKAVLGDDVYKNLSDKRKQQSMKNTFKAEILNPGYLPLQTSSISKIQIPCLLINGEDSPKIFKRFVNHLHKLLEGSEHVTIPNASHIVHEDNAETFNDYLRSFIDKVGPRE